MNPNTPWNTKSCRKIDIIRGREPSRQYLWISLNGFPRVDWSILWILFLRSKCKRKEKTLKLEWFPSVTVFICLRYNRHECTLRTTPRVTVKYCVRGGIVLGTVKGPGSGRNTVGGFTSHPIGEVLLRRWNDIGLVLTLSVGFQPLISVLAYMCV